MMKTILYGAAAGALAIAGAATPLAAAPAAKTAPDVQSNVTNAQVYFHVGPRYHRRHYYDPYYYGPPPYYYGPRYRYYHW
jgi:hypothetical protein